MDVRHLRYMLAVADERSFTRAAERLYISQPGLSRAIRDLEQEIGLQLFDRSGRRLELTEDGVQVAAHARAAVAAFDEAVGDIHALTGRLRGALRVGVSVDTWPYVRDAIARLRDGHPELRLELSAGLDRPLSRQVDRRELDAAILWWPELDGEHGARLLATVPALLVVPTGSEADHRLAGGARDVAGALDGASLALFDRNLAPPTYDALMAILAPLGEMTVMPVPVAEGGIEGSQTAMLHMAATQSMVTAVTPAYVERHDMAGLSAHAGVLADVRLTMVHNPRAAGLARAIAADLASFTAGSPPQALQR